MNLEKASTQLSDMLRHSREPLYIILDGVWQAKTVPPEYLTVKYTQ